MRLYGHDARCGAARSPWAPPAPVQASAADSAAATDSRGASAAGGGGQQQTQAFGGGATGSAPPSRVQQGASGGGAPLPSALAKQDAAMQQQQSGDRGAQRQQAAPPPHIETYRRLDEIQAQLQKLSSYGQQSGGGSAGGFAPRASDAQNSAQPSSARPSVGGLMAQIAEANAQATSGQQSSAAQRQQQQQQPSSRNTGQPADMEVSGDSAAQQHQQGQNGDFKQIVESLNKQFGEFKEAQMNGERMRFSEDVDRAGIPPALKEMLKSEAGFATQDSLARLRTHFAKAVEAESRASGTALPPPSQQQQQQPGAQRPRAAEESAQPPPTKRPVASNVPVANIGRYPVPASQGASPAASNPSGTRTGSADASGHAKTPAETMDELQKRQSDDLQRIMDDHNKKVSFLRWGGIREDMSKFLPHYMTHPEGDELRVVAPPKDRFQD